MMPKSLNFSSGFSKYVPEDKNQLIVETPYGKGIVVRTRKKNATEQKSTSMYEIEMVDWTKFKLEKRDEVSRSNPSNIRMLYTPIKYPSIRPAIGSDVLTKWGKGKVIEIRDDNRNTHVVKLSSWRLANRSSVFCYVSAKECEVVKPRKLHDMDVFEKVEYANNLKQQATIKFKQKNYQEALELFAKAIDAVRYVQHGANSTNELRADLIAVIITCSNNAALCSSKNEDWLRAAKFGENALVLIEALEEKGSDSKIKAVLNRDGISDSQLFGTWKVKSLLIIAKSQMEQHKAVEMTNALKKAHKAISMYKKEDDNMYKLLLTQEKDIKRLRLEFSKKAKAALIKEKKRARAMFGDEHEKKDAQRKEETVIKDEAVVSTPPNSTRSTKPNLQISLDSSMAQEIVPNTPPAQVSESAGATETQLSDVITEKDVAASVKIEEDDGDDYSDPTFFEEHIEALLILTGIAVGCFLFKIVNRGKKM